MIFGHYVIMCSLYRRGFFFVLSSVIAKHDTIRVVELRPPKFACHGMVLNWSPGTPQ